MRWAEGLRANANYANGNARDRQGRLVSCEHSVTRQRRAGRIDRGSRLPTNDASFSYCCGVRFMMRRHPDAKLERLLKSFDIRFSLSCDIWPTSPLAPAGRRAR